MVKTGLLVLGFVIAGLTFALKIAQQRPDLQVTVLTKTNEEESNTRYAQGGVAAVWNFEKDSYDKHIKDTLIAGDGLFDEKIVEIVVTEGPAGTGSVN
ncbi:MAG: FAD-binding protein [Saprospiraceae bacterium]|nr:MAG: FAD-binding protein [Saprospiraceae bacterium]